MKDRIIQSPRGTRDILPEDHLFFDFVQGVFESVVKSAGFGRITTPVFEDTNLFVRGVGKNTDIVEKEMYTFDDKSNNSLTLRPEGTASIVRAYLQDGMQAWPQPVRLYYFEPMYRYDRPQAGRYREFWQFGFEVIGDKNPLSDAMVINTAYRIYRNLGLAEDISLQLNSIGCAVCRPKYLKELTKYYKENEKQLCDDCKRRLVSNPLRLLDCKESKCQSISEDAPKIVNSLCKECYEHFKEVLEYLDSVGLTYEINPKLVRGLDYYAKTVFEFWDNKDGSQNALGGGGRYDGLVQLLGGKPTPALGFAGGVDRVVNRIKISNHSIKTEDKCDVFVAQLGTDALKKGFILLNQLWTEGIDAEGCLDKGSISEQLKAANRLNAAYTLIIGQKEAFNETVILKDMHSGSQEVYPEDKVVKELKDRLNK